MRSLPPLLDPRQRVRLWETARAIMVDLGPEGRVRRATIPPTPPPAPDLLRPESDQMAAQEARQQALREDSVLDYRPSPRRRSGLGHRTHGEAGFRHPDSAASRSLSGHRVSHADSSSLTFVVVFEPRSPSRPSYHTPGSAHRSDDEPSPNPPRNAGRSSHPKDPPGPTPEREILRSKREHPVHTPPCKALFFI